MLKYSTVEVISLVVSNLSMLPAIWYSYKTTHRSDRLFHFTIILSVASIASIFYHLCDTGTYCIGSKSFFSLQMLDVLVAGTCLMSIPLYYAPISVRVHCQSTLLVMVLLVVPVADDPINASTMFIGMGGSLAVSLLLWILQYKALQNDLQKYSYDINGTESLEDGDSAGNTSDKSAAVDIPVDATYSEMESNNGSKAAFSNSSNENKEQSILEDSKLSIENNVKASSSEDNVSSGFGRLSLFLSSSGYTIVGVIMAILALICFSMQEGDQYWYMHSLWHILIMGSVYPLLVGRKSFYDYMYNCISK